MLARLPPPRSRREMCGTPWGGSYRGPSATASSLLLDLHLLNSSRERGDLGCPISIALCAHALSSMPAASASSRTRPAKPAPRSAIVRRRGRRAPAAGGLEAPTREIVDGALTGLACVRHRQAIAADGISGDGAGLLVPIPRPFFARVGGKEPGRTLAADRA